jgi:hypothetical protein
MNRMKSLLSNRKETVMYLPILPAVSTSSQLNGNNSNASQSQNGLQGVAKRMLQIRPKVILGNNRKNTQQSSAAEEELDSDDEV